MDYCIVRNWQSRWCLASALNGRGFWYADNGGAYGGGLDVCVDCRRGRGRFFFFGTDVGVVLIRTGVGCGWGAPSLRTLARAS
jgi:hypothetical protein